MTRVALVNLHTAALLSFMDLPSELDYSGSILTLFIHFWLFTTCSAPNNRKDTVDYQLVNIMDHFAENIHILFSLRSWWRPK